MGRPFEYRSQDAFTPTGDGGRVSFGTPDASQPTKADVLRGWREAAARRAREAK